MLRRAGRRRGDAAAARGGAPLYRELGDAHPAGARGAERSRGCRASPMGDLPAARGHLEEVLQDARDRRDREPGTQRSTTSRASRTPAADPAEARAALRAVPRGVRDARRPHGRRLGRSISRATPRATQDPAGRAVALRTRPAHLPATATTRRRRGHRAHRPRAPGPARGDHGTARRTLPRGAGARRIRLGARRGAAARGARPALAAVSIASPSARWCCSRRRRRAADPRSAAVPASPSARTSAAPDRGSGTPWARPRAPPGARAGGWTRRRRMRFARGRG